MHQFHGQPSQNRITKSKKLLFRPLQLCLIAHVLHFFKIMSNTLMISVTHFFHSNITVEILDTLQFKKLNVSPEKLT